MPTEKAETKTEKAETKAVPDEHLPLSINEPPTSNVGGPPVEVEPPEKAAKHPPPLEQTQEGIPADAELERMTRAELDELAEEHDVDIRGCSNKGEVIEQFLRHRRRQHRHR